MNRVKRVLSVLGSLCIIGISMLMLAIPDMGYALATVILGIVLMLNGLKNLLYYISMGIHMVGGRVILYRALITLDLGVFTFTIQGIGQRYIMFYFIIYYIFDGIISIFRAQEARKYEAGSWKLYFLIGIYDIALSVVCLLNNNSEQIMLEILCLGLVISAVTRIGMAFRKSAIIYIQ